MGREIRRVPPNWEHPKKHNGDYWPLYDKDFKTTLEDWMKIEYEPWKSHGDINAYIEEPPDPNYFRPKFLNSDWYQLYETVSEGTPVTPPFASKEELGEYLLSYGDFYDQKYGRGAWSKDAVENILKHEWQPTMVGYLKKND